MNDLSDNSLKKTGQKYFCRNQTVSFFNNLNRDQSL